MKYKTFIFLDSPYSRFTSDFASYLKRNYKAKVEFWLFDIGYLAYINNTHKKVIIANKLKNTEESKLNTLCETPSLLNHKGKSPSNLEITESKKFLTYLTNRFDDLEKPVFIFYNDLRWQNAVTIYHLKSLNIPYLIIERGVFRPFTTTCSTNGINGYFKLNKKSKLKHYSPIELRTKGLSYSKFAIFLLLHKIGKLSKLNTISQNKNYSILEYALLLLKQKFQPLISRKSLPTYNYVFIPLQVPTDTQCLIHSDFSDTQEVINLIESEFKESELFHKGSKLVFKSHPMDNSAYKLDHKISEFSHINTDKLISESLMVITVNSTVGFEALKEFKNVYTLGESFYSTFKGITKNSTPLKDFLNTENIDCKFNKNDLRKFIEAIRSDYQIEGSIFNYNDKSFEQMLNKIV